MLGRGRDLPKPQKLPPRTHAIAESYSPAVLRFEHRESAAFDSPHLPH